MLRIIKQTRGGKHNFAFPALQFNNTTSTRFIHNVKLVGLHKKVHQPAIEMLRLHGLRLHGPAISTVGTIQVHKNVDVAFYKATMLNIKLAHLHDSLHKPPAQKISFAGLCLHDHERYLQPMNQISLETFAKVVSQSVSGALKITEPNSIDAPKISVAYTKISIRDETSTMKKLAETSLMSTISSEKRIGILDEVVEKVTWTHNGHTEEILQSSEGFKSRIHERL